MTDTKSPDAWGLLALGASTLATFASMAFLSHKNEVAHERLQKQLDALAHDIYGVKLQLKQHEEDDQRHVGTLVRGSARSDVRARAVAPLGSPTPHSREASSWT